MRVVILSPTAFPSVTGNAMTVHRWERHLVKLGVQVRVLATSGLLPEVLEEEVRAFGPDLIHVHHLYKAGGMLIQKGSGSLLKIPIVASPGGTDVHMDITEEGRRELVFMALEMARAIVVQEPDIGELILRIFPGAGPKLSFVPKSPEFVGLEPFDLRGAVGAGQGDFLFFLPAGIRPVKGMVEWLRSMEEVHRLRGNVRVALAGPILDREYGRILLNEVKRLRRFAKYLGIIPPACMKSAYQGADVVVNSSSSEGMSNALLEALSLGIPLFASDVPGNRYLILGRDGLRPCGLLYRRDDPHELVSKALALVDCQALRLVLGSNGRERSLMEFDPAREAELLMDVYKMALCG